MIRRRTFSSPESVASSDGEQGKSAEKQVDPGRLYVVATPIGNLEDITLRALRILGEVALIAAEDTRVTRKLLSHYDIHTPLTSFHAHTRGERADSLVERLLRGESIALVSDAGTPAVSDPGADLIALALAKEVQVVPVPGPNAAISALVASGLPAGRFAFDGFPPRARSDRRAFFLELAGEERTIVLYESPTRILTTLLDLRNVLGDRPVSVARELTKLYEEIHRGTLSSALQHFDAHQPRGEFTIVVGGKPAASSEAPAPLSDICAALRHEIDSGSTSRDAVRSVADALRLPRRVVYRALIRAQREGALEDH